MFNSGTMPADTQVGMCTLWTSQECFESHKWFLTYSSHYVLRALCFLIGELGGEESVLRVNRLILPPQKGSRDQVEMLNEEVLLEETMMKGFIVLGWIHTHPEFDCFLSSIDVHTTLSYQLLLEEAIAIVMAPKDKKRKCGVFRLSTPGGLELVKDCQERGFHQHGRTKTGQPVYEVSSHVYINPDMKVVVSDRRAG